MNENLERDNDISSRLFNKLELWDTKYLLFSLTQSSS